MDPMAAILRIGRCFAEEIAAALHRALGLAPVKVKIAAFWTGANERTAKNWFSGRYGPSDEHLVALARNSDEVLNAFLAMAGRRRPELIATTGRANLDRARIFSRARARITAFWEARVPQVAVFT